MHSSNRSHYREIIRHPVEHLRVLGPPGSGKTTVLLERYRSLSAKNPAGRQGIAILTYTKESAESLTEALLPEMSAMRKGEPVYRYYDLAKDVLGAAGGGLRTIGQMEELVLLDRIVAKITEGSRSGSPPVLCSEKYQRVLLKFIRSLIQNGLSSEEARALIDAPGLSGRLAGVADIYNEFCEALRRERLTTDYDICWRAVEALQINPNINPLKNTRVLLIDDFQDVDSGQYALLSRLAPPSGTTKVNVFGDPTAAHFRFKGTQHGFLMHDFVRRYDCRTFHLQAVSAGVAYLDGALASLLDATLGENARRYLPVASSHNASNVDRGAGGREPEFAFAFEARPDEFNEALHVAERVKALLADGRYQPQDIAVTAREKHRYEILLSSAFQYYGIPLETGRHRRCVVENFIVDLLALVCSPDDEAAAGTLSASPFYRSFEQKTKTLLGSTDGQTTDSDEAVALKSLADAVRNRLFAKPPEGFMATLLKEIVLPVVRGNEDKALNPSVHAYLSRLLAEWGRYLGAIGSPAYKAKAEQVCDFMIKCGLFDDSFAPLSPVPGRVGFFSCHELKGRTFPVVFLLGCSEMLFPIRKAEEGIIPYGTIQRASDELFPGRDIEFFPARSTESHLKDEFSLLLLALTRASHKFFISAPKRCAGEMETGPTSIVHDALPQRLRVPDASHTGRDGACPPAAQWADHMVQAGGEIAARFAELLRRRMPGLSPVPLLWHAAPLQERDVTAPRRHISQSSLRSFDTCPRRYFYSKVLSLPEEDSLAMRFGALFHEVMKELGREFPSMDGMHGAAAKGRTGPIIEEVLRRREGEPESNLVERSVRYHLERMVEQFFELDKSRSDNYTIRMVESPLTFTYGNFDFIGIVDRLDSSESGRQVVIDYKTGEIKKTGAGIRKNVVDSADKPHERDWQVPLYAHGVLSKGTKTPVVFSYYNIQAGEKPFAVSLFIDEAGSAEDPEALFAGGLKKRFDRLETDEVKTCMDDAVRVAQSIFAPTNFFTRTQDEERCRFCTYRAVCKRGEAWN